MAEGSDIIVFQQLLRPYRAAIVAAIPIVGTIGTYGYDVVNFMHRDEQHETSQDENLVTLRKQLARQEERTRVLHERSLETIELLMNDLDLLRAKQVMSLPMRERERARRDFDAQRAKAVSLLVKAQRMP